MYPIRTKAIQLLTVLVLSSSATLGAEESPTGSAEREAVLAAVQEFFATMTECDPDGARKVVDPNGRFFRVRHGGPGEPISHFDNAGYLDGLSRCETRRVERLWDAEVRVHRGIAVVWAPYDFWRDGVFSHCGIDAFNLVDTPEGWKIVGGVYTVEPDDCKESPLGPLSAEPSVP